MIRINLQPSSKAIRKKENIISQIVIFTLIAVVILGGLMYVDIIFDNNNQLLQSKNTNIQIEISKYEKDSKKVIELKKKLQDVRDKLNVIRSVASNRNEAIIIVERLSQAIVINRMWFNQIDKKQKDIKIAGVAYDNKTVADFLRILEDIVAKYQITDQTIQELEKKNIPKALMNSIKSIKDREFLSQIHFETILDTLGSMTEIQRQDIVSNATQTLFAKVTLNKTEQEKIEDINLKRFEINGKLK